MLDVLFLTVDEVVERYRGAICTGTLRNWRGLKIGPSFLKLGKSVLYPLAELETWERKNMVICAPRLSVRHTN
ncbi:DNA-binding protein [Rhizobium sp. ICMP 5592]|uniref:DNA-binding protein n=1 Tax=Rhizobium sp. ICMP 5592 TaxID=2292445 RepID=UPI000DDCEEC6|nr:DNA-binding protein [Rhizobium sp. ICMP 5592]MQB43189.1 DNA-binding protein [Rhizobium sp. ICMP 5592]